MEGPEICVCCNLPLSDGRTVRGVSGITVLGLEPHTQALGLPPDQLRDGYMLSLRAKRRT